MGRRVVPRVLRPSPLARGGGGAGGLMRKLFVVLGDPVAHSRSPAIHARAFALLGVDAAYAPCRVPAGDLERALDGLRALGADGFNVTVPHKTAVAQLVDRLQMGATRIGAVSCVARDGEALVGHNTDAPGLLRALRQRGIAAADGIDVLVQQAIASLEIWLSRPRLDELAPALREAALA